MPFAVHLDLDPPSAAALTPLIDAVERADPDAMTPRRAQVAPHLSLGVYDRLDAAAMSASLQRFAALQPACDIQLSSLGLFPGPPAVLFAAPVSRPSCSTCTAACTTPRRASSRTVGCTTCRVTGYRMSRSARA